MSAAPLCNLTVDEALGLALDFAERAEAEISEHGLRFAAVGQIYASIAAVRQQQTQTTTAT
ncbi:hypothetical protein [Streptomyces hydrogenans]|uniref:hypothetical protein n=1 Tax=Streptomyces hydrogenans TaxID=1873719 RepID=UPI0036E63373